MTTQGLKMRPVSQVRAIASIYDAALAPELWPAALKCVSEALGAAGAAYLVENRRTGHVEWASQMGPADNLTGQYLAYYSNIDPYRPMHDAAPAGSWLRLSTLLPRSTLSKDEWYNDFVLRCGVADVLGARLFKNSSHITILGVHQEATQTPLAPERAPIFGELLEVLTNAARLDFELRQIGWQSRVALRALDSLSSGVIVTESDGRIVKLNSAAESIVRRGDALIIRNGRLCSLRTFETEKLAKLIAAASPRAPVAPAAGRIPIGRCGEGPAYVLTVAPLGFDVICGASPLAMILIADLRGRSLSETALAELFGLSPAESRLAGALMTGKRLNDIAACSGVKITTLRTQLRSILRKVGVDRQTQLVQVLSKVQAIEPD